jgi:hypothetical protein
MTIGGAHAYARKHNPFMSFVNINSNETRCSAHIVNSAVLDTDASSENLPNYMFYTPNLFHDGHDSSLATTSAWLKDFLEPKLDNPVFGHTLFWITFDESSGFIPGTRNPIYGVLLGAGVDDTKRGVSLGTFYNHYNWLATVERIFNLGDLGLADATAATFPVDGMCHSSLFLAEDVVMSKLAKSGAKTLNGWSIFSIFLFLFFPFILSE